MELRHLRYFVALAEELSFTRAAHRLHMSQPPLSTQISQLEEEIGVLLFERSSRRVQLTSAGQAFLADARTILDRVRAAASHARAVGSGLAGRIEIGLSGSHFQGPLPSIIARYLDEHPDVAIVLSELKPAIQLEELRSRRIDLSISRTPVDDAVFTSIRLWSDPVVAALPRGHALGKRKSISLHELRDQRFVMFRLDSSAYARYLHNCCVQAGFAPLVVQTVVEVPAIISMVAAGIGVALVPQSASHLHTEAVDFVSLGADAPKSDVFIVLRRDESSSVVTEFTRLIAKSASALKGASRRKVARIATEAG
jgi:DNA-binding transcriptional LysR family regulator